MYRKTLTLCILFALSTLFLKAITKSPFGNPIIPDMIADASIQEIDGVFYCYATTDGYDRGLATSGPPVVWKSKDFVKWSFSGFYFPSAVGEKYWAPSKAIAANGKYYIYPTVNGFMYPAVSDSPDGPFKLAQGEDKFSKTYSSATLLKSKDPKGPAGIDAEIFIDDDNQAYVYWQRRFAAKLNADWITVDTTIISIPTPRKGYSEGPIFFKRKGIYYYIYTLGASEKYQYAYVMSRKSPLGPFETPTNDIISTTNYARKIFGPGHGCVFNLPNTDNYFFAYLEYGRGGTNRQTYVNQLVFNEDGTIKPVDLTMDGVGALHATPPEKKLSIVQSRASSICPDLIIPPTKDTTLRRTEEFATSYAFDGLNGSRWMAAKEDSTAWIVADLGKTKRIKRSEVYFVRPTAGHAYQLEFSTNGRTWKSCGSHAEIKIQSPHTDHLSIQARYLRIRITEGVQGIWEWNVY